MAFTQQDTTHTSVHTCEVRHTVPSPPPHRVKGEAGAPSLGPPPPPRVPRGQARQARQCWPARRTVLQQLILVWPACPGLPHPALTRLSPPCARLSHSQQVAPALLTASSPHSTWTSYKLVGKYMYVYCSSERDTCSGLGSLPVTAVCCLLQLSAACFCSLMALLKVGRALCPRLASMNTESRAWVSTLEEVRRINGREEAVVLTDDGKTVVCWHPQPDIPYEMTKVCGTGG
ncbi:hypothetical protein O3P69_006113 [Scylla paramamosain]|uniref:Uncharacterized protein n=1 Tax=Scylla paramamosain TaxID=85552 RepID=A0AAW0U581_SCYPA